MNKIYTILIALTFLTNTTLIGQAFSSARLTLSAADEIIRFYNDEATAFNITQYLNDNIGKDLWVTGQFNSDNEVVEIVFNSQRLSKNTGAKALKQKITIERIPWLGLTTMAEQNFDGVLIDEIITGSSAEKMGLKKGDIITQIGTDLILESCHMTVALNKTDLDKRVNITYIRNGKMKHTKGRIASRVKKKITWDYPQDQFAIQAYNGNTEVLKP